MQKALAQQQWIGVYFLARTCFLQMRILAHCSFIYYISKMFYYSLNVCRVFMLITLIVYISNYYKIFAFFHTKKVIWSLVIFRMILMSQKKEEVYNILIISNLYINIYFFCFQFLEKWLMTNDFLPITTFNVLILSILRTLKSHSLASFCPEKSFFDCNQKCTYRAFSGVNR